MSRILRGSVHTGRLVVVMCIGALLSMNAAKADEPFPRPQIPCQPRHYLCTRTGEPVTIDGQMTEGAWNHAPWTEPFVDIQGTSFPQPRFRTRAKMLYDDTYFYVAAEMEEPHVWGALTERDAVIYHDNDFEVFIDPDADTHEYYELEINALGTEWDLLLVRPYRDGAPAVNAWDIQGLRTAIHVDGTLNDPRDTDRSWCVEIAFPWKVLAECAHRPTPPASGDQWRVNFSRVQWLHRVEEGRYVKRTSPETGRPLPEDNWVWSPQGLIAMHYPEMWGVVQFGDDVYVPAPDLPARAALWEIYYAQREYQRRHGRFAETLAALSLETLTADGCRWPPTLHATPELFETRLTLNDGTFLRIRQDGRIW